MRAREQTQYDKQNENNDNNNKTMINKNEIRRRNFLGYDFEKQINERWRESGQQKIERDRAKRKNKNRLICWGHAFVYMCYWNELKMLHRGNRM